MDYTNQDIEQLKERMVEIERKVEELHVLAKSEWTDLTIRPPFKQDRARREYYSKACMTLAQISIGTAVATLVASFISPRGITLKASLLILALLAFGFLFMAVVGSNLRAGRNNYGCANSGNDNRGCVFRHLCSDWSNCCTEGGPEER